MMHTGQEQKRGRTHFMSQSSVKTTPRQKAIIVTRHAILHEIKKLGLSRAVDQETRWFERFHAPQATAQLP